MQNSLISKENMYRCNIDTILVCIGLFAVGFYLNGVTALYQALTCIITAVLCEYLVFHVMLKRKTLSLLSSVTTGFVISMLLPASAPLWVGASASAFAIVIATMPFGDSRNTPFLPAAAGFCFAAMFFPEEVFTYPALSDTATLFFNQEGFTAGTPLTEMLAKGYSLKLNVFGLSNLLSGRIPGAVGTVSLAAMTGVAGYFLVRQPKRLLPSLGFIISAAVIAFCFPRINAGRLTSAVMELCAGSLLFVALIMINNPVTVPKKAPHAFLYGIVAGIICMLLRYFSSLSDPCVFTVIIMNMLWSPLFSSANKAEKRKETDVNV